MPRAPPVIATVCPARIRGCLAINLLLVELDQ
jgi:hypothetical protein